MTSADKVGSHGLPETHTVAGSNASSGTLESAIAFLRGRVRSGEANAAIAAHEFSEFQWRELKRWAVAERLVVPTSLPPLEMGGREHDLRHDSDLKRWLKYTKPHNAGYAVSLFEKRLMMLPAKPLQYLERWQISNDFFGDVATLEGLFDPHGGTRIVISQKDLVGEAPTWEEMEEMFVNNFEMTRLLIPNLPGAYEARAYIHNRIAVFDVRPNNCVKLANGFVAPIDVIPHFFGREDADTLRALAIDSL